MNYLNFIAMSVPTDGTGFTFWLGAMAMMAASVFFFLSMNSVDAKWRTSLLVSGLITFIAAVHYMYMRDAHAAGDSTTVFRYVDWILTVPLMCVEFYLILKVAGATKAHMWKLIALSTVMLVTGFFGESGMDFLVDLNAWQWGLISGIAYFWIAYEVWLGSLKKLAVAAGGNVISAHKMLCWFVLVGWSIYPLGYMAGTEGWYNAILPALDMEVIYNLGDAVNKIGFGLVVYSLAVKES
jgi:bacteriorhodopsin